MKQRYFSNIYWHFTGSPVGIDWGSCSRPQDILKFGKPKPPEVALTKLFDILDSHKLLATCEERISEKLRTHKFCCVTDIPLMDLELHSKYYGKVAIGFNCVEIQKEFNPVLYFPNFKFPRKYLALECGREFISEDYDNLDTEGFETSKLGQDKYKLILKKGFQSQLISTAIDSKNIDRFFSNYLKITRFSSKIGQSFYQEREWRCFNDFKFKVKTIESIIVPKKLKNQAQKFLLDSKDYKHVALITWEFLRQS